MDIRRLDPLAKVLGGTIGRRAALARLGAAGAALAVIGRTRAAAQEATPVVGECVATAPAADASGIGLASLLVGGIIRDMPAGPVEVRLTRLTLAPGAGVPAAALPYPSLMYIETGTSWCPGDAGKTMYGADGAVLGTSNGQDAHACPVGTTWYIPAGLADGAVNEGTELMSSILIAFVPATGNATRTAATPAS